MDLVKLMALAITLFISVITLTMIIAYFYVLYTSEKIKETVKNILEDPSTWEAKEAAKYVKKFFTNSDN